MQNLKEVIKINYIDAINSESAKAFVGELKSLSERKPNADCVWLNISSPGGEIDVAIELYYFLKQLECRIITNNLSVVNSAAIILYLAGCKRYCNSTSTFYVHSVTKKLRGSFDSDRLLREAKELRINTDRIIQLLISNTNRSGSYWRRLMKKGEIITSERALNIGIVTDIIYSDSVNS